MDKVERIFMPGSEWLYFKIYTGAKISDQLIVDFIKPMLVELESNNIIKKYFFIRYYDTDYHIRLRLMLSGNYEFDKVLNLFYKTFSPLINYNVISNIQIGTYRRELERYGFNSIEYIEDFFFLDSKIIFSLIEYIFHQEQGEQIRWLSATYLIDFILSCFNKQIHEKFDLISSISANFLKEFNFNSNDYTRVLNDKYREYKNIISNVLDSPPEFLVGIINIYKEKIQETITKIIEISSDEKEVRLNDLIGSIIHMSMNRIFQMNNRIYELMIYCFLTKLYKSQVVLENKMMK